MSSPNYFQNKNGPQYHGEFLYKIFLCIWTETKINCMYLFKNEQPCLHTCCSSRTPPHSSNAAASTAETTNSDNESVKLHASNEKSGEFKILFDVGDIP